MEFRDAYPIPAEPGRVWSAMLDPEVMRQVLPGCRRLEQTGDGTFDMTLAAGIGVLRGVFTGTVTFHDLEPTSSCAMDIAAKGSLGRVIGIGTIGLAPDTVGTMLSYHAAFTFAGPMAGLGESLMRGVADSLTREAMKRFSAVVAIPTAGA
jgi:carbon monoxide dehydrogenase subunit G